MANCKYEEFRLLLYQKFVSPSRHDALTIARKLSVPLSTFYGWIDGVSYFPPDLLSQLHNATGDVEFLEFVIRDTNLCLSPLPALSATLRCPSGEAMDIAVAAGNLIRLINDALSDEHITEQEERGIEQAVMNVHRQAEEALAAIEHRRKQQGMKLVRKA